MELRPIGWVRSTLRDATAAPKQGVEGGPEAWVELERSVVDGASDLAVDDEVLLLTWLDRADREVLQVHPRDDPSAPLRGVFSTRSADRPNPIGIHRVRILEVDGTRMRVSDLEALDGTPVVDVKPVLDRSQER